MANQKSTTVFSIVIIISMFIWGVAWPSGKILSAYGSTVNIVFMRFVIVFFGLLGILLFTGTSLRIRKDGIWHLLGAGLLMAVYGFLFLKGLKSGLSGAGGVLTTTLNPIMAYGIGLLMSGKRPTRNEGLGLLLGAIAGCVLLKIWVQYDQILASGNIYFLLAAFTWALMSKIASKASSFGSPMSFSLWMYLVTVVCMGIFVDFKEVVGIMVAADTTFWVNIIYNGLISTSLATTAYLYATTTIGAEKASSFIFLVPLSAAFSSWIILDEKILPHTILGGILGILAVYLINLKTKQDDGGRTT